MKLIFARNILIIWSCVCFIDMHIFIHICIYMHTYVGGKFNKAGLITSIKLALIQLRID